jgi:hypothetical protein
LYLLCSIKDKAMNYLQKTTFVIFAAVAPFLGLVTQVYAEEIVVSGNGSESANAASSSQSTSVNVEQNNTATVENNVNVVANTGGNTASDNSNGDTVIATGDVAINEQIVTNVNGSVVTAENCCGEQGQIAITGNGSGSNNHVLANSSTSSTISVGNSADIANKVRGLAITGNNTASDNHGNVRIKTGDIRVSEKIATNANLSFIKVSSPLHKDYILTISDNGSNSSNTITNTTSNDIIIAVNNNADIFNSSFWDLVTGNNKANGNSGDVLIATGDIAFESTITNNVNISEVIVTCCKVDKPEPIVPPENPVQPKSDNNSVQGASATAGGSSNSSSGPSLPSTGSMWFFLALFGNLAALIYGTYLRLRSGRSPAYALA